MKQPHCFMRDNGVCRVTTNANPDAENAGITLSGSVNILYRFNRWPVIYSFHLYCCFGFLKSL